MAIAIGLAVAGQLVGGSAAAVPAPATRAFGQYAIRDGDVQTASLTLGAASLARNGARASRGHTRATPAFVRPARGQFSSPYGRRWGRMHRGIDISAPYGSPIYAVAAGRIVFAGSHGGYGRRVEIRHASGTVTSYSHMSRIAVQGGKVRAGQVIGSIGTSGHSTGAHLHFEVVVGGVLVNPRPWLRAHGIYI